MSMNYSEAVARFGAERLADRNGRPLAAAALANRIKKLESEDYDQSEAPASHVADEANTARGSFANPLPAARPEPMWTDDAPVTAASPTAAPQRAAENRPRQSGPVGPFHIETGVPMPQKRAGRGDSGEPKYPFNKLAIGQSFFVPVTAAAPEPWRFLSPMGSRESRLHFPRNYTARRVTENGLVGCRVWRIADLTEPKPQRRKYTA